MPSAGASVAAAPCVCTPNPACLCFTQAELFSGEDYCNQLSLHTKDYTREEAPELLLPLVLLAVLLGAGGSVPAAAAAAAAPGAPVGLDLRPKRCCDRPLAALFSAIECSKFSFACRRCFCIPGRWAAWGKVRWGGASMQSSKTRKGRACTTTGRRHTSGCMAVTSAGCSRTAPRNPQQDSVATPWPAGNAASWHCRQRWQHPAASCFHKSEPVATHYGDVDGGPHRRCSQHSTHG